MNNTNIHEIINALKNTNSINDKIQILQDNKDDELLKNVLKFTYDSSYVFGIKKIPNDITDENEKIDLKEALKLLECVLVIDKVRGHKATKFLSELLGKLNEDDKQLVINIIKKDLRCGVNARLISKVFPDLLFNIGYMGAVPYDSKKIDKIIKNNYFIFSQEKMDGEYSNLVYNEGVVEFLSRNNKPQNMPSEILNKILSEISVFQQYEYFPNKIIFNGELLIKGFDRYTSNGLLTRIFKYQDYLDSDDNKKAKKALETIENIAGVSYNEIINKIEYFIWDFQDETMKYFNRYMVLFGKESGLVNSCSLFKQVQTKIFINKKKKKINEDAEKIFRTLVKKDIIINDTDLDDEDFIKHELFKHFSEIISEGGEGTIVKAGEEKWVNKKPVYQVKLKLEFECEMKIIDFKSGEKGRKYENTFGSFITISEDGKVSADPGGVQESMRDEIWNNKEKYLNKIITVKCNGLSKDKDGNYSLLHPRFIEFRDDKDEADTLEKIIEIEESVKNIKKDKK